MDSGVYAIYGATIALFSSFLVYFMKETFDRRRQWRTALNILIILSKILRQNIAVKPELVPHLQLEKVLSQISDIPLINETSVALLKYEEALTRYRISWSSGSPPPAHERDEIVELLDSTVAICDKYRDHGFSSLINWLSGIRMK